LRKADHEFADADAAAAAVKTVAGKS